jgi:hypothetical protein
MLFQTRFRQRGILKYLIFVGFGPIILVSIFLFIFVVYFDIIIIVYSFSLNKNIFKKYKWGAVRPSMFSFHSFVYFIFLLDQESEKSTVTCRSNSARLPFISASFRAKIFINLTQSKRKLNLYHFFFHNHTLSGS